MIPAETRSRWQADTQQREHNDDAANEPARNALIALDTSRVLVLLKDELGGQPAWDLLQDGELHLLASDGPALVAEGRSDAALSAGDH